MNLRHLLVETYAYMPPANALAGLTDQEAMTKPGNAPHSIAEILAHVDFWQDWFLSRCRGEHRPFVQSAAEGWPAVEPGTWTKLHDHFVAGLEEASMLGSKSELLDNPVTPALEFPPLAEYTLRDALVHVATHNSHHLGQIITLRQFMGLWPPPSGSWTW